ncbi:hypothetical protein SAMN05216325_13715 [Nitrosomonas marina]|uniref:Uncharacterized protein n=1 Tax=Nitrosomonas marina TaxID=917 RepID=A0A1H8INZ4_9PROT|nr:hypothetical protein SAMN05216325_13715 [Nitrosomonas marina]
MKSMLFALDSWLTLLKKYTFSLSVNKLKKMENF